MPPKRKKSLRVERDDQWEAMISPVRFEIWEFLRGVGPCSIKELAVQMDRAADGLYHHIRILSAAGLVAERGVQKSGRRNEAVYDVTSEDVLFDFDLRKARNVEATLRLIRTVIRCAGRAADAAIESRLVTFKGPRRTFWARWDCSWLTEQDLEQVNEHLVAIGQILERGRTRRQGRLFAVMSYLTPIFRRRTASPAEPGHDE